MLVAENITKKFSGVTALDNVCLELHSGKVNAILGENGAGKSTLMNTLGCLDRPTSGSYKLDGQEIVTMGAAERARIRNRQIGFVFQNFNLLVRTSAVENVELPLMYGPYQSARARRDRAVERSDPRLEAPPGASAQGGPPRGPAPRGPHPRAPALGLIAPSGPASGTSNRRV